MDNKVQELANKIYQEGVEKASNEAEQILKAAEKQKEELLIAAKAEAEKIVAEAEKQVKEHKENSESELRLASHQAIEALRTEITDMINDKVATAGVSDALKDESFLQGVISKMAEEWSKDQAVTIETADAAKLEAYFKAHTKNLLSQGVTIKEVNGKTHAFDISPKDGSYKVSISKEAFVEYFKEFMRPKLRQFLFFNQD